MSGGHRIFEVHCALAVSGELGDAAFAELTEHARECDSCRERLGELMLVGSGLVAACDKRSMRLRAPAGMLERFAALAAHKGVPLKQRRQRVASFSGVGVLAVAVVCAVLVAILITHPMSPVDPSPEKPAVANAASLHPASGSAQPVDPASGASVSPTMARVVATSGKRTSIQSRRVPVRAVDETHDVFRIGEMALAGKDARWAPVFVWSGGSSRCEEAGAKPLLQNLDAQRAEARRVFCYNPRMATLTSLDLLHAAASNAPPVLNLRALALRFPGPTEP